jgi:hypothetical protein
MSTYADHTRGGRFSLEYTRMHTRLGASLATLALALAASAFAPRQPDVSETAVVAAAAGYVASYQTLLTSILADEDYNQRIVELTPPDPEIPRRRRMESEIFFMFAPVRHDWMTSRDVRSVDGRAVRDRPDLRAALRTLPPDEVAGTFKTHNSRYNIGRTFRNFNEPTLSLLVLDDHHRARFVFERRRVERAGDATLVTLAFTERDTPTLITNPDGAPVFANGEVIVEAGSGRVRRVRLTAKSDVRLELTTVYAPDDRLGMWVPSRFSEEYELGTPPRAWSPASRSPHERILCEAAYTNFRRFDTSVRIK